MNIQKDIVKARIPGVKSGAVERQKTLLRSESQRFSSYRYTMPDEVGFRQDLLEMIVKTVWLCYGRFDDGD